MTLNLVKDGLWKGGACTKPVPFGQATWTSPTCTSGTSRLGQVVLVQWDRQPACTKPVPLGLGKVKRDLSLSHGTSHIPTLEAFPCPGTSSIPTMQLVPVPLVPICPTKWVYKAVKCSLKPIIIGEMEMCRCPAVYGGKVAAIIWIRFAFFSGAR